MLHNCGQYRTWRQSGCSRLQDDVEGILKDIDDPGSIIRRIRADEAARYIEEGIIRGGMIPKAQCCIQGIRAGVHSVHILDGRIEHSILLEVYTDRGIGTMVIP